MKSNLMRTLLCLILALLLAASALTMTGCDKQEQQPETTQTKTETAAGGTEAPAPETTREKPERETRTSQGDGLHWFNLDVTFADGEMACFEIHTDAETLDKALMEQKLVAGDFTDYGLYIKTVIKETHDYDADGTYWAFYINGEYAMTGVSQTQIEDGALYALKAEGGQ